MIYFLLTISIVVIDQISKYYAQTLLQGSPSVPLIQDVFHLTYARNTGAAFSMLAGNQFLLKGVTTVIMIFLVGYLYKLTKEKGQILFKVSLAFILGGGIGNLIDRIRLDYVIDYFDFTLINFAIFNVADSFVVIGTIVLGYLLIFNKIEL
ncbi:MAG TPA: signal peptidase II [Clostridia bacterium]|nr:signal peptidase II [Clostridia bacterium]